MSTPLDHLSCLMWLSRSFRFQPKLQVNSQQLSQSCLMARNACVCPRQARQVRSNPILTFPNPAEMWVRWACRPACRSRRQCLSPQKSMLRLVHVWMLHNTSLHHQDPDLIFHLKELKILPDIWFWLSIYLEISAEAALWMCLAPLVPISWSLSSWEMQWSTSGLRTQGSCWGAVGKSYWRGLLRNTWVIPTQQ